MWTKGILPRWRHFLLGDSSICCCYFLMTFFNFCFYKQAVYRLTLFAFIKWCYGHPFREIKPVSASMKIDVTFLSTGTVGTWVHNLCRCIAVHCWYWITSAFSHSFMLQAHYCRTINRVLDMYANIFLSPPFLLWSLELEQWLKEYSNEKKRW